MKLSIDAKENQVEERKVSEEKQIKKILINSIIPKPNHFLFEFSYNESKKDYDILQIDFRKAKEIILVLHKGQYVKKKEEARKATINIFDAEYKPEVKRIEYDFKEGCGYITALNKDNAIKKFKELNR